MVTREVQSENTNQIAVGNPREQGWNRLRKGRRCEMKTRTAIIITLLAWTVMAPLWAYEREQRSDVLGYRPIPECASSVAFALNVESARIAVFPSIVRTVNPAEDKVEQEYSILSRDQVVEFLGTNDLGTAIAETIEIDLKETATENKGQLALFEKSIKTLGKRLSAYEGDAGYFLMFDIIFSRTSVHGIQCYILDREGTNVFSFLLDSDQFVDAKLYAEDDSPETRQRLIAESTHLALTALKEHVVLEREIATYKPDSRHAGIYASRDSPSDYFEFRPDASFVGMKNRRAVKGTYAVIHDSTVVLTVLDTRPHSKVHIPVGELKDDTLYFRNGDVGKKTETIPKDEFKSWIGSWDSDDDGMIPQEEFLASAKTAKAQQEEPYDLEKAEKYFEWLDTNKDGFITPNEEPRN